MVGNIITPPGQPKTITGYPGIQFLFCIPRFERPSYLFFTGVDYKPEREIRMRLQPAYLKGWTRMALII